VGTPLPHLEVRIDECGEVEVRGPSTFLGYVRRGKFEENIDEWLKTGDRGHIDSGHLHITGRDSNLIVLSSGRNVSPEWIENKFRFIPQMKDFIVVGHGRPFLTGLAIFEKANSPSEIVDIARASAEEMSDSFPEFARLGAIIPVPFEDEFY